MSLAERRRTGEKVGSIGSARPTFDRRNRRVKGFSLLAHRSMDSVRRLFEDVRTVERENPRATRTTVRAFVRQGLVEQIRGDLELPYDVEAAVPAGNAVEGCSMVYFGRNTSERMPNPEIFRAELDSVREVSTIQAVSRESAIKRTTDAGFRISDLTHPTEQDVRQLLELYREAYQKYTFEINEDTIGDMLNGNNIVLIARDEQGIASALIAERCQLELEDGRKIWVVELSDYATLRRARRNGLTTAMQIEIVEMLRAMEGGSTSVIYAEDRAAWIAVNISSAKAGLTYFGTLPKHCILESDRDFLEHGQYETLNVWAATR